MKETALILEGGGMRGVYTAGVLDFFLEKQIEFEYCIAISAGACHGVSYLSKQHKRNYRIGIDYIKDKRYLSLKNLITTGSLFGMEMLFDTIPNELDPFDYKAFKDNSTRFNVGVTNCETGLPEYYEIKDLMNSYDALRASMSLPLVAPIVEYDHKKLLDGGISDPIPIKKALAEGYKKQVIVLTQHKGYQKTKSSAIPIIKRKYKKYPKLIEAMEKRHEVYNDTLNFIDKLEQEGKVFIIRPSKPLGIGRFENDKDKLRGAYQQGYEDTQKIYRELISFLK